MSVTENCFIGFKLFNENQQIRLRKPKPRKRKLREKATEKIKSGMKTE